MPPQPQHHPDPHHHERDLLAQQRQEDQLIELLRQAAPEELTHLTVLREMDHGEIIARLYKLVAADGTSAVDYLLSGDTEFAISMLRAWLYGN